MVVANDARNAHARHFAGREADIMALWDSPRQREAYVWFSTELANLRSAFRWAANEHDLDTAAAIATWPGGAWYGAGEHGAHGLGGADSRTGARS